MVIHSGGVDIVGPVINLNGGGSVGTPVPTLQPAVLRALVDESDSVSGAAAAAPRKNVQGTFNSPREDLVPPQLRRIFSR
ncbi:hypothetical protein ACFW38_004042 [Salmonella enterica]